MKNITFSTAILMIFSTTFLSCMGSSEKKEAASSDTTSVVSNVKKNVNSKEEQGYLTPDATIAGLKEGNARFVENIFTEKDHPSLVMDASTGQYPKAVILSCMDSRVPVELIFDESIGDLFVCRVAGNILNDDMIGSMEYGCKVVGSKAIVILGHGSCGAVVSAIKNVELGNITQLLDKINPAIANSQNFAGEKTYSNQEYVREVTKNNCKHVAAQIAEKSPILKEMLEKGEIKIVTANYDLNTGKVAFDN